MEAYCVKCKAKHEMKDTEDIKFKNGKDAIQGKCTTCNTRMVRIVGKNKDKTSDNGSSKEGGNGSGTPAPTKS